MRFQRGELQLGAPFRSRACSIAKVKAKIRDNRSLKKQVRVYLALGEAAENQKLAENAFKLQRQYRLRTQI